MPQGSRESSGLAIAKAISCLKGVQHMSCQLLRGGIGIQLSREEGGPGCRTTAILVAECPAGLSCWPGFTEVDKLVAYKNVEL